MTVFIVQNTFVHTEKGIKMDELRTLETVVAIILVANIVEFAVLLGKIDWLVKQYEEWIINYLKGKNDET